MTATNTFSEETIDKDPFAQFRKWYDEHLSSGTAIPESVSLGTSDKDGRVSVRTVLLKDFNERGFFFFTNYKSKKGSQLLSNPYAALLFYWQESGRQVRIEGKAEKISEDESLEYFKTRPRESQLSAWASEQSTVIPGREYLEKRFLTFNSMFSEKQVEKPVYWGGFLLVPDWFEFWQDREYRLHDRIIYTKIHDQWAISRLAP